MSTDSRSNKNSTSTVDTQTNPWAPQAEALTSAFSNAQGAYSTASSAVAPKDFTAQFTPEQLSTFRTMLAQGGNQGWANDQASAGSALTGAGVSGSTGALSGYAGFDPSAGNNPKSLIDSANQYVAGQDIDSQVRNAMLGATQTARDVTLPGISQAAANTGNTNSSRTGIAEGLVQRGLAQQSTDLGASLRSTAFQNGLTLAQQQAQNNNASKLTALQGQGALGTATTANGFSGTNSAVANQGALNATAMAGGAGLQAADQANLTNQGQQYASATQSPYANVQQLMSIIGGQNWGSSTTGTTSGNEETTRTPSLLEWIGGLAGAAGSAGSLLAGSSPTINTDVGNGAGGHPIPMYR